ncbi:MAG: oligosaccharide flippase family protein [Bacteroidales bacterium]|nr:oligosaccharide flippase family protein [Bacteroidales bacterium]
MFAKIRSAATQTLVYSIGNLAAKLTGFILLPLYTSHLSIAEYGTLGLLETLGQFLAATLAISLPTALLRWISTEKDENKRKSIVFTTLISLFTILVLFNSIAIPLRNYFSLLLFERTDFGLYISLLFLSMSFDVLNLVVLNLIRFHEKPGLYIIINTVKLALILGLNIYFIAGLGMGVEGVILGQLIGSVALNVISMVFLFRNMLPRFNRTAFKEMIRYGFPLIFTNVSALILALGDRFIIEEFLGLDDLGLYTMGYRIAGFINVFILQSFQLGFLPIAYKMFEEKDARRFFSKVLTYFVLLLLIAALFLSLFAREAIMLFSPNNHSYWAAYAVVPLISLSFVFKGMQYYFSLGLHYAKQTGYNAMIVMVSAVVSLGLNFLLIPRIGIIGSAISINIATIVMMVLYYHYSQKFYKISFEIKRMGMLFLISGVLFFIAMIIPEMGFWLGIIVKLILFSTFPVLLWFSGFLETDEKKRLSLFWLQWRNPVHWASNFRELINRKS